ncbi:alanine racemase [Clostridium cavendishii DSM 21758]|uniref:Alanine racemase n=1 Tax=Clostridium cavendishii DSM 21758 TaxID=1121302 RepID=A0A1M6NV03_9CLOT|nr:alanine racemase [Clostridium cavendishii]SHJ99444.1 alanine racemase [Clostridium cavendishii DSM 21758]
MKNFWCEVDLDKIQHNVDLIKGLSNKKKFMAVLKGNAYGLGIEKIAEFLEDKVDYFAVADLTEARRINTEKEILLLSPLVSKEDFAVDMENLIYTVDNEELLESLDKEKTYKIHIYVDTGMSRMGIKLENLDKVIENINSNFKNIIIDGIYSHLHNTKDVKYTLKQIESFKKVTLKYKDSIQNIHLLNSSGLLKEDVRKAVDFTNLVRCGNVIYGYDGFSVGFKKVYSFKAKAVNKHKVKKGSFVGYSLAYKAKRNMTIGVLGFGNIEHFGFSKDVKHNVFYDLLKVIYNHIKFRPVIFKGNTGVKILGRPNMNVTLIDFDNFSMEDVFTVDISPILADSAIEKVYKREINE